MVARFGPRRSRSFRPGLGRFAHHVRAVSGIVPVETMHHRSRTDDGVLETRVVGPSGPREFVDAVAALPDFAVNGLVFELVFHDSVKFEGSFADFHGFIDEARQVLLRLSGGAIAYVATTDFEYGICRQLRALLVVEKVPIEVFRDADEARTWLRACAEAITVAA